MKQIDEKLLDEVITVIANAKHDFTFLQINGLLGVLKQLKDVEVKEDLEIKKDNK